MKPLTLRPFQKEALSTLRAPKVHLIAVAPTGSGKSLIFEHAAQKPNVRMLLVTPLIALGRQQQATLQSRIQNPVSIGVGPRKEQPPSKKSGVWIISPESLFQPRVQAFIRHWRPNFLTIDEAHCFWDWGERFRPTFDALPELISNLQIPKSLWLTATLPFDAKRILLSRLPQPQKQIGRFDVSSKLSIRTINTPYENRIHLMNRWLRTQDQPGIIFVPTRDLCHRLSRIFALLKKRTVIYHAGLSDEERRGVENQMTKNQVELVVATSAFGMGMNYPNLRWVVLWNASPSLLAMAQAIGRTGRNEKDSTAILFWTENDFKQLEWRIRTERQRNECSASFQFYRTSDCRVRSLRRYFDPDRDPGPPCKVCSACQTQGRPQTLVSKK